jgi:hypothetical protein
MAELGGMARFSIRMCQSMRSVLLTLRSFSLSAALSKLWLSLESFLYSSVSRVARDMVLDSSY